MSKNQKYLFYVDYFLCQKQNSIIGSKNWSFFFVTFNFVALRFQIILFWVNHWIDTWHLFLTFCLKWHIIIWFRLQYEWLKFGASFIKILRTSFTLILTQSTLLSSKRSSIQSKMETALFTFCSCFKCITVEGKLISKPKTNWTYYIPCFNKMSFLSFLKQMLGKN